MKSSTGTDIKFDEFAEMMTVDLTEKMSRDEYLKSRLQISATPKGCPLYIEAYRKIRELIVSGYCKKGDKFLSEAELAGIIGIGRTSLRTALVLLYEDGYLKTYQGKGTYVVYNPPKGTQDYPSNYLLPRQRLKNICDNVSVLYNRHRPLDYDPFLDETLQTNGEKLNMFQRTYSIDGLSPAIIMNVYYPQHIIPQPDYNNHDLTEQQLEQVYQKQVDYVTCTFTPAPSGLSRQVPNIKFSSENFVLVSATWHNAENQPILYCKDHYNGNSIKFKATFSK